jgi:hypothetical protein
MLNLLPFSGTLLKLHLNHTAILTPNPSNLRNKLRPDTPRFFCLGGKYKGFENCDAVSLI